MTASNANINLVLNPSNVGPIHIPHSYTPYPEDKKQSTDISHTHKEPMHEKSNTESTVIASDLKSDQIGLGNTEYSEISKSSENSEDKKTRTKKRVGNAGTNGEINTSSNSVAGNNAQKSQQTSSSSASRRQLELDAYAAVVTAFKAQGELTWKKDSLLQDLRAILKISDDRHKMEARRAEETLSYASITPTKKHKPPASPTAEIDGSDLSESSDRESLSDGERQLRKKMKLASQKDLIPLNSYPLPSSDQTAFVNKIPGESKGKKDGKDKKKAGRPSKSKQPNSAIPATPTTNVGPTPSLNITLAPKTQDSTTL